MGVSGQHHPLGPLPPEKTPYALYRGLGGPCVRSGWVQKIWLSPWIDPQTVQPVVITFSVSDTMLTIFHWLPGAELPWRFYYSDYQEVYCLCEIGWFNTLLTQFILWSLFRANRTESTRSCTVFLRRCMSILLPFRLTWSPTFLFLELHQLLNAALYVIFNVSIDWYIRWNNELTLVGEPGFNSRQ